jgi:hypothetical protein
MSLRKKIAQNVAQPNFSQTYYNVFRGQGDQIGRIFGHRDIVFVGQFFKLQFILNLGLLFSAVKVMY